jgi:hypothetical protein
MTIDCSVVHCFSLTVPVRVATVLILRARAASRSMVGSVGVCALRLLKPPTSQVGHKGSQPAFIIVPGVFRSKHPMPSSARLIRCLYSHKQSSQSIQRRLDDLSGRRVIYNVHEPRSRSTTLAASNLIVSRSPDGPETVRSGIL